MLFVSVRAAARDAHVATEGLENEMGTAAVPQGERPALAHTTTVATRLHRHGTRSVEVAAVRLHIERRVAPTARKVDLHVAGMRVKLVAPFRIDRTGEASIAGDALAAYEGGGHILEDDVTADALCIHLASD